MNQVNIRSNNGLSLIRQAIIWINAGLLPFPPYGTNFSEIMMKILHTFYLQNASENIVCEMTAILSREGESKTANDTSEIMQCSSLKYAHGWHFLNFFCGF